MNGNLKLILCAVGFIALMTACEVGKETPTGAPAEPPSAPADAVSSIELDEEPTEDQIVFMSKAPTAGGGWAENELYRMNNNGSGLVRLTRNTEDELSPRWSPDGNNLVYNCGAKTVCISKPDGTKAQALYTSTNGDFVYDPALSPDGSKLAFSGGDVYLTSRDLFVYDLTTGTLTNLTKSPQVRDSDPVWHPLGGLAWLRGVNVNDLLDDQIMYAPGGTDEVYVITDGGTTTNKTNLDVSPDGNRFVFSALGDTGSDIYLYDVQSEALTKLTQTVTLPDEGPTFSPDGTQIAFYRKDQASDKDTEIYTMNVDGSGVGRLTFNDHEDVLPDWGTPAATVSVADVSGDEGDPGAEQIFEFEVRLSVPQTQQVKVTYAVTTVSASSSDLTTAGGTVTFAPGEKVAIIEVPITADTEVETSESFKVTLSNPIGAVLGDGEGRGLIVDDDTAPSPSPSPSASPSPSPEPTGPGQIAFSSTRNDGNFDIWIMGDDGAGARALTNDPAFDGGADVSPDGSTVIFQRGGSSGPPDIYSVPVSGNTPARVNGTSTAADVTPAYNPAGTAIVWASGDGSTTSLLSASPPTGTPSVLADEPGDEAYPSWGTLASGDEAVAFQVQSSDTDFELRLKNLATGAIMDLGEGRQPEISPDGTKLVYASVLHGDLDIYVRDLTNLSATALHLTTDSADDSTPTWSPDGTLIAFTTGRDGNAEIYVMNADGSGQTNITNNPADDFEPSWGVTPTASAMPAIGSTESSPEPTPEPSYDVLVPLFAGLSLAARRKLRARQCP